MGYFLVMIGLSLFHHSLIFSEVQKEDDHRTWIEGEIKNHISPQAAKIIVETKNAIDLIKKNEIRAAKEKIQEAITNSKDLLSKRQGHPPVLINFVIKAIDDAPQSLERIKELGNAALDSVEEKNYPAARLILDLLRSEINIYTYFLSLDTYPNFLKKALDFLNQNNLHAAEAALRLALDHLIIDRQTIPIPVFKARVFILQAEKEKENTSKALSLLSSAHQALQRARILGYLSAEKREYESLNQAIIDLEDQINFNLGRPLQFESVKAKMESLLRQLFHQKLQSNLEMNPEAINPK